MKAQEATGTGQAAMSKTREIFFSLPSAVTAILAAVGRGRRMAFRPDKKILRLLPSAVRPIIAAVGRGRRMAFRPNKKSNLPFPLRGSSLGKNDQEARR